MLDQFNQENAQAVLDKAEAAREEAIVKAIKAAQYAKELELTALSLQESKNGIAQNINSMANYLPAAAATPVKATFARLGDLADYALPFVLNYSRKMVAASQQAVSYGIQAEAGVDQAKDLANMLPEGPKQNPKI